MAGLRKGSRCPVRPAGEARGWRQHRWVEKFTHLLLKWWEKTQWLPSPMLVGPSDLHHLSRCPASPPTSGGRAPVDVVLKELGEGGEEGRDGESGRGGWFVLCAAITVMASASPPVEDGFERCENIVQSWADSSNALKDEIEAKQLKSLQDALFFLHVPRTGGLAFVTWQPDRAGPGRPGYPMGTWHVAQAYLKFSEPNMLCQRSTIIDTGAAAVERDARRNQSMMSEEIDPYNLNQIALPLHDFVNDPLVHELVHNAVTLQVAGLTENSCLQESHAIRRCIRMHPLLGNYVLDVAKKRLDKMFFVGLTEKHRESMEMFAHKIEAEVQSLSPAFQVNDATGNDTELNSPPTDVEIEKLILQKAHKQIQNSVIQPILLFNNLDIELHTHAEAIFKRQQDSFKRRHSKVKRPMCLKGNIWAPSALSLPLAMHLAKDPERARGEDRWHRMEEGANSFGQPFGDGRGRSRVAMGTDAKCPARTKEEITLFKSVPID
ncbi:Protein-tyrosine sulfotransferase [Nymphaea thermarum]|nr:Protein-tyrosine sulfotransferase [Nymphaea thermarum]